MESYLTKAESEAPRIREHASNAPSVKEQARQVADQAKAQTGSDGYSGGTYSAGDVRRS